MRDPERQLNRTAAIGLAVLILAVAGYVGSASGVPTVRSPLPLATTLPIFWFWMGVHEARALRWVIEYAIPAVIGPLLLVVWHPRLLAGADEVPRRSPVGLVLISILTVADLAFGWQYGVKYQGKRYTMALVLLNAVAVGGMGSVMDRTEAAELLVDARFSRFRCRLVGLDRIPMAGRTPMNRQ
jgi:hypothetical protein